MITQIMEEYKIMTTFEKIQELITEQLDLEAGEVKATTNIREDIDADSLDLFQIINDIEDEFDIEIEDEEKINTDRKSTRLNSSHVSISYAVFCLNKKHRDRLILYV